MDLRRTCTKFLNEHCCMVADANEILRPQQGLAEKVLVLQKVKNIVRLHSFWIKWPFLWQQGWSPILFNHRWNSRIFTGGYIQKLSKGISHHLSGVNFHAFRSFWACSSFSFSESKSVFIRWNNKLTAGSSRVERSWIEDGFWACFKSWICVCG